LNAIDRRRAASHCLAIQIDRRPARQPPLRSVHNRGHHLQIPLKVQRRSRRVFVLCLSLRFEKTGRSIQMLLRIAGEPLRHAVYSWPLPVIAVCWAKIAAIPLAILQAFGAPPALKTSRPPVPGSALAHLLLNGFRQNPTSASRRDTQFTLRSNRRANSSSP